MNEHQTSEMPSTGLMSRLVNIFSEPAAAMKSIDRKPDWLIPFLIVIVITVALTYLSMDIRMQDTMNAFEAQGKSQEMIEGVEKQMSGPAMYIQLAVVPVITLAIWAILAGILIFAGNVILGGESQYKKLFSMVAWSALVATAGVIVQTLLIMTKGTTVGVTTSLAVALPTPAVGQQPSILYRLLSQFDLFALWQMWIWVIGVSVFYRFTRQKSAIMVFSIWGVWVLLSVALGSVMGKAFGG